ncbi:MAG TPA: hypothetical protein VK053_20365, partial [Jiangellaceae bacterium]|nr:hypothetical protein [Jiangellaceae bacterium]
LAAYRVAFARLYHLPLQSVTAAFHHVREQRTLRPADLLDEDALRTLLDSIPLVEEISSRGGLTSG